MIISSVEAFCLQPLRFCARLLCEAEHSHKMLDNDNKNKKKIKKIKKRRPFSLHFFPIVYVFNPTLLYRQTINNRRKNRDISILSSAQLRNMPLCMQSTSKTNSQSEILRRAAPKLQKHLLHAAKALQGSLKCTDSSCPILGTCTDLVMAQLVRMRY